ncbi:auxin-responsive protein IAA9-like isoform X2 [Rhodamnia argentea]|uniref:Auxin-responsive protein n=1 Tax=Rhodamnia argentea TaxID=178133 RepID=A0A8B8P3K1_9MYRT|nr:auxin-responsive protein IAA9-like isoform X2 [Rhodamnia argentea]
MSPPLLGVGEEECQSNGTLLASSSSLESVCENAELKEHNYMGLADRPSENRSVVPTVFECCKITLTLKATELRLGLPGSQSPERDADFCAISSAKLDEKPLFPLHPSNDGHYSSQKIVVSGNKRGFADAMCYASEGEFMANPEANVVLSPRPSPNLGLKNCSGPESFGHRPAKVKEITTTQIAPETQPNDGSGRNIASAPAPKQQVVGWPPIRSFRKNSLATTSKNAEEVDGKPGSGALFVKVSMDGAPYLRKVDLKHYSAYQELSSALEKMFSCFTIGALGREMLSESNLKDLLGGAEHVLTYEDKDADWMLVGDVPWEMFLDTCKRLRIMKSCDAIGLAPRAVEKSKNKNELTSLTIKDIRQSVGVEVGLR